MLLPDTHGEGNYASTGSSENRDRKTDHGLTLPLKIPTLQSNELWLLIATLSTEGLEDFESTSEWYQVKVSCVVLVQTRPKV
jgi:hypothetical protein